MALSSSAQYKSPQQPGHEAIVPDFKISQVSKTSPIFRIKMKPFTITQTSFFVTSAKFIPPHPSTLPYPHTLVNK